MRNDTVTTSRKMSSPLGTKHSTHIKEIHSSSPGLGKLHGFNPRIFIRVVVRMSHFRETFDAFDIQVVVEVAFKLIEKYLEEAWMLTIPFSSPQEFVIVLFPHPVWGMHEVNFMGAIVFRTFPCEAKVNDWDLAEQFQRKSLIHIIWNRCMLVQI